MVLKDLISKATETVGAAESTTGATKSLTGLLGDVKHRAADLADAAKQGLDYVVDEYQRILDVLEPLGFKQGPFSIGMGVPPEIHTTIEASIAEIDIQRVRELMADHQGRAFLYSLLKALVLAYRLWERTETTPGGSSKIGGVTLKMTLGLKPNVEVEVK